MVVGVSFFNILLQICVFMCVREREGGGGGGVLVLSKYVYCLQSPVKQLTS
jgi:hypothetical protein